MERNLKEALKHRRSYYALDSQSPISDEQIEEIIRFAVAHTPSAFNSQSTRLVLLLGEHHRKLWKLVKETLKKSYRRLLMKQPKRKSTNLFWLATELYFSMKIKQLWKVYKKLFPCIRINFRNGLNIRRLCISLSYGLCWKMPDSGLLCNITIL